MKRPNLKKWQNLSEIEGLLFFAQTLEELLFHHTVDAYKAPALNTRTRTLELMSLALQFSQNRILAGTLIPVIEELRWSIINDPVIEDNFRTLLYVYMDRIEKCRTQSDELLATSKALNHILEHTYWELLKKGIRSAIANPTEKSKILGLATTLTAEIELLGYSRIHLYLETLNFFFDPKSQPTLINELKQVDDFFKMFEGALVKWTIIHRGSADFMKIKDQGSQFDLVILDRSPFQNVNSFRPASFLGKSSEKPLYIISENIEAYDPYRAIEISNAKVEHFVSTCLFYDHNILPSWTQTCLVKRSDIRLLTILNPAPNPMTCGSERSEENDMARLKQTIEILKGKYLTERSQRLFINALDYHRAALDSRIPENQLLDLWAALEGFLPPPKDERILHYVSTLLPPLTLTYPEKIFRYITKSLNYGGSGIREYIQNLNIEDPFFDNVISLLVSEEMSAEREHLFSLLNHHPLLRFHCFKCYEEFHSTKHIKDALIRHQTKVTWHIQRIYTTRNSIIHSASALSYLPTLVENLHSYLDILMHAIIQLGVYAHSKIDIPSAVKTLSIQSQNFMQTLSEKNVVCNKQNYRFLIFGNNNALSPYCNQVE